jgi:hypothetical protein
LPKIANFANYVTQYFIIYIIFAEKAKNCHFFEKMPKIVNFLGKIEQKSGKLGYI